MVFVVFDVAAEGEVADFVDDGDALRLVEAVEALGDLNFVLYVFDAVGAGDEGGDGEGEGKFDAVFEAEVLGDDGVVAFPDGSAFALFFVEEASVGEGFHGEGADVVFEHGGDGVGDVTVGGAGVDGVDGEHAGDAGFSGGWVFEHAGEGVGGGVAGEADVADFAFLAGF